MELILFEIDTVIFLAFGIPSGGWTFPLPLAISDGGFWLATFIPFLRLAIGLTVLGLSMVGLMAQGLAMLGITVLGGVLVLGLTVLSLTVLGLT